MRMTEQADKTGEKITYSWLLEALYAQRKQLLGWKWIRGAGCKGCYVTNDSALALRTAKRWGLNIGSNSTHEVHKVPMFKPCQVCDTFGNCSPSEQHTYGQGCICS
jgi:hypothetical protein